MVLRELFDETTIRSLYHFDGSFFAFGLDETGIGMLHNVITIPFSASRMIANVVDFAIEKLYSLNLLTESLDEIMSTASTLWNKFFGLFGVLMIIIVLAYMVKDYYTRGFGKAFVRLILFFFLIGGANGFFTHGTTWVREFNQMSGDLQSELTDLASADVAELNEDFYKEFNVQKPTGNDAIRDSFYTMTVLRPWALMNFGKSNISVKDYREFLVLKSDKDKDKKIESISNNVKERSKENYYMSNDSFHEKFFIGITSLVNVIVLGVICLVMAILNPLLQLLILVLILLAPIYLTIGLLPDKEDVMKNVGMLFLQCFGIKALIGLGFGFTFTVFDVVDNFFQGNNIESFFLSFILKSAAIILVYKKRDTLMGLLTGRKTNVTDFDVNTGNLNRMTKAGLLGVGGGIGAGASYLYHRLKQESEEGDSTPYEEENDMTNNEFSSYNQATEERLLSSTFNGGYTSDSEPRGLTYQEPISPSAPTLPNFPNNPSQGVSSGNQRHLDNEEAENEGIQSYKPSQHDGTYVEASLYASQSENRQPDYDVGSMPHREQPKSQLPSTSPVNQADSIATQKLSDDLTEDEGMSRDYQEAFQNELAYLRQENVIQDDEVI